MIYIEVINVKWEPGVEIGVNDRDFESYIAKKYVELVKDRVNTQKYKPRWIPLAKWYLEWKKKKGLSTKTWEATGELGRELKVKKNNVIGYDNRKRHRGSGDKYLSIARKLEYGDGRVPARPLFRLVYWYMRKNVKFFYRKYLREV